MVELDRRDVAFQVLLPPILVVCVHISEMLNVTSTHMRSKIEERELVLILSNARKLLSDISRESYKSKAKQTTSKMKGQVNETPSIFYLFYSLKNVPLIFLINA